MHHSLSNINLSNNHNEEFHTLDPQILKNKDSNFYKFIILNYNKLIKEIEQNKTKFKYVNSQNIQIHKRIIYLENLNNKILLHLSYIIYILAIYIIILVIIFILII